MPPPRFLVGRHRHVGILVHRPHRGAFEPLLDPAEHPQHDHRDAGRERTKPDPPGAAGKPHRAGKPHAGPGRQPAHPPARGDDRARGQEGDARGDRADQPHDVRTRPACRALGARDVDEFERDEGKERRGDGDQHMGAQARGLVVPFAFKADRATKRECGQHPHRRDRGRRGGEGAGQVGPELRQDLHG
ncbi:hypothetical protein SDC9_30404 [bioreactor metagenome]|uniref:Uncharacterized protein n=1 Tax=bioreactor metagenome TaxID=1076179 RepID=A0A644UZD3_9ZZZZ